MYMHMYIYIYIYIYIYNVYAYVYIYTTLKIWCVFLTLMTITLAPMFTIKGTITHAIFMHSLKLIKTYCSTLLKLIYASYVEQLTSVVIIIKN